MLTKIFKRKKKESTETVPDKYDDMIQFFLDKDLVEFDLQGDYFFLRNKKDNYIKTDLKEIIYNGQVLNFEEDYLFNAKLFGILTALVTMKLYHHGFDDDKNMYIVKNTITDQEILSVKYKNTENDELTIHTFDGDLDGIYKYNDVIFDILTDHISIHFCNNFEKVESLSVDVDMKDENIDSSSVNMTSLFKIIQMFRNTTKNRDIVKFHNITIRSK